MHQGEFRNPPDGYRRTHTLALTTLEHILEGSSQKFLSSED
ncbi:hypothetical protein L914_10618 [Phytophthora nicotianae]|uniref:Uncharacterized protein n=1 Tax=Phytophthora nicotianae TaxID=4792 RepID=W2N6C3_PHYNI|nr:hypothetical protein L914_10618 [Phytophthora nicotianae]